MKVKHMGAAIAIFVLSSAAIAQTSAWQFKNTPDGQGVIYRTEVVGASTRDKTTRKARTALQLTCAPGVAPMIMLQWENLQGTGPRRITYSIDNKPVTPGGKALPVTQENDILYRTIASSQELLQAMKTGSTLSVDWVGLDQTRYLTVFNLSTFRSNLSEFNKRCNTDI